MTKKQKKMTWRIIITFTSLVILHFLPLDELFSGILKFALYMALYILISGDILRKAGQGILNRQVFDENFLMAIASLGAFALALYTKSGDYVEAVAVMLFYQVGELFENIAVGKAARIFQTLWISGRITQILKKTESLKKFPRTKLPRAQSSSFSRVKRFRWTES